ncbi:hypothetical protein EUX98_g4929 [Antrodiella citrinella]|uniref:Uncharacterized protein n=1 Tax=Antrodiella citrinella TaxID=2447956 RepID=A0A4V3XII2_9APHY|nr:hypothetical protein EUX98_g4929 [Antrodiella citrinella]
MPDFSVESHVDMGPTRPPPSLLSFIFIGIKQIEEFLINLDEETNAFLRRVDRDGFTDLTWRDRQLRHFGRLSLYWEKKWSDSARLLKEYDMLWRDFREVNAFRRMRIYVLLEPFEMECHKRGFPSPRHLALEYEAEKALSDITAAYYVGGVDLRRCCNNSFRESRRDSSDSSVQEEDTSEYEHSKLRIPRRRPCPRQVALQRKTVVKKKDVRLCLFGCIVA